MADKVRKRLYINKGIDKKIKEISKQGTEYLKEPLIDFMDFDDEGQTYNYLLKLGIIKLAELRNATR